LEFGMLVHKLVCLARGNPQINAIEVDLRSVHAGKLVANCIDHAAASTIWCNLLCNNLKGEYQNWLGALGLGAQAPVLESTWIMDWRS